MSAKVCEQCKKRPAYRDERYCYFCRKWLLRKMGLAGYLQRLPRATDKALPMGSGFDILTPGK